MVKTKKRTWWGFCLYLQRRACERTPSARVFCTYKKRTWWGFCLYLQRRACERAPSARVFVLLLFMPEIEFFNKFCIRLALFLILVPIIRISGQHLLPGGRHPGAAVAHGSV